MQIRRNITLILLLKNFTFHILSLFIQGLFGLALTALVASPVSPAPASTFNAFSPFNDATTSFSSQNNGFDTKVLRENFLDRKLLQFKMHIRHKSSDYG